MRRQLLICGLVAPCLLLNGAARAQLSATLTDKKNVVKYSRNNVLFLDAPLQQVLNRGEYVVTGARSMAGIRFSDRSYLRVNESSKITVATGSRQRDVALPERSSSLYGNLNGPGRMTGRQAVCAVRGTELEFLVMNDRDVIRCFGPQGHLVLVTSKDNALITGHVTTAGAAQIASTDLIGNGENWVGGKLEFLEPGAGRQTRTVTAFDPTTGLVTLSAPLVNANNAGAWFYIINPPNARVVFLDKNMETYVPHVAGGTPVDPYPTEPKEFAGGDPLAFMNEPLHGNQQTHLTGFFHDRTRQFYYELDNARDASQQYQGEAPNIQTFHPRDYRSPHVTTGPGTGDLDVGIGSGTGPGTGNIGVGVGNNTGPGGGSIGVGVGNNTGPGSGTLGVGVGNGSQPGTGGIGVGIGNGGSNNTGGLIVNIGRSSSRAIFPRKPELGGVGYSTSGSDSILGYANDSAVVGGVYMRVGGRIATLDRHADNQLDEFLVRYRNSHVGDIQVGRFHWFPGPVSNGQQGRLIGFTSTDGVLWDLPGMGAWGVQLAWFDKINPLSGPRKGGYSGRVTLPIQTGQLGITALTTSQKTIGLTSDFVFQVLPQRLELYGEFGVDTFHQTVYSAGLYFPELFHRYRMDLSLEWAYRGGFGHTIDLALHLPAGRHLAGLIMVSKPGAGSWRPGVGLQARY